MLLTWVKSDKQLGDLGLRRKYITLELIPRTHLREWTSCKSQGMLLLPMIRSQVKISCSLCCCSPQSPYACVTPSVDGTNVNAFLCLLALQSSSRRVVDVRQGGLASIALTSH